VEPCSLYSEHNHARDKQFQHDRTVDKVSRHIEHDPDRLGEESEYNGAVADILFSIHLPDIRMFSTMELSSAYTTRATRTSLSWTCYERICYGF
jgi:hypothetical protein